MGQILLGNSLPLDLEAILDFGKNKINPSKACLRSQVVCPCLILFKLNERNLNAEQKCDLWGQIWLIYDL